MYLSPHNLEGCVYVCTWWYPAVICCFQFSGDQLKKYLEPVLKRYVLDKPRPRQASRDSGAPESEEGSHRRRSDSVTENMSESEGDTTHMATPSTASTPHTPPTQPRKSSVSSVSSDVFAPPILHYPFSTLNLLSLANMGRTPSDSSLSIQGTSSPSVNTPSSIDSGISLRTQQSIQSPVDCVKSKKTFAFLSSSSQPPPPLPPPEENAPPLPPPLDSVTPPPPLPPLPPAPSEDSRGGWNDCGIENISSDEEESVPKPPLPQMKNEKPVSGGTFKAVDAISPVSLSPSTSAQFGTGKAINGGHHHVFDPSLGLRTLLAAKAAASMSLSTSNSIPTSSAPAATSSQATTVKTDRDQPSSKASPYVGSSSPRPISLTYDIEVEEISGDESPVMVCFEPLKVETISDDDMNLSGEDMEMCSDDENAQDNVIEVNVKTSQTPMMPATGPMLGPHGHPGMPHPPFPPEMGPTSVGHPHPPPPPPPLGYYPPPPPGAPFPPPHLPPLPPRCHPDFEFISPPHPARPPHMMLHPPHPEPVHPHHYHNSPPPFINDVPISRLPNGYIGRHPPSRSFSKSKMFKGFSSPKSKRESISQDVLYKAMEQLRLILLNDVHKKIVENSAYPVLDSHWEKREKEVHSHILVLVFG